MVLKPVAYITVLNAHIFSVVVGGGGGDLAHV